MAHSVTIVDHLTVWAQSIQEDNLDALKTLNFTKTKERIHNELVLAVPFIFWFGSCAYFRSQVSDTEGTLLFSALATGFAGRSLLTAKHSYTIQQVENLHTLHLNGGTRSEITAAKTNALRAVLSTLMLHQGRSIIPRGITIVP